MATDDASALRLDHVRREAEADEAAIRRILQNRRRHRAALEASMAADQATLRQLIHGPTIPPTRPPPGGRPVPQFLAKLLLSLAGSAGARLLLAGLCDWLADQAATTPTPLDDAAVAWMRGLVDDPRAVAGIHAAAKEAAP